MAQGAPRMGDAGNGRGRLMTLPSCPTAIASFVAGNSARNDLRTPSDARWARLQTAALIFLSGLLTYFVVFGLVAVVAGRGVS